MNWIFGEVVEVVFAVGVETEFVGKLNKTVDDIEKTPHNLVSLLLTNKTIRGAAEVRAGQTGSLKINSR